VKILGSTVAEVVREGDEDDMFVDSPHFKQNHHSFAKRLRTHAVLLSLPNPPSILGYTERQMGSTRGETPRT